LPTLDDLVLPEHMVRVIALSIEHTGILPIYQVVFRKGWKALARLLAITRQPLLVHHAPQKTN
jgi:hypothetical protein